MRVLAVVAVAGLATLSVIPVHAADEPDELMPGRVVIIRNAALAKFVARPAAGNAFDLPDSANDPTSEGGQLLVFDDDPFRPVSAAFTLQPSGWKGLGSPAGARGYRYTGAGSPADPCRTVLVKASVVKAVCKGPAVTLPTPFTGQVGIVLTVGTDSKRYCSLFGGTDARNDGSVLRRKDAPPPGGCPLDLNSSTTSVPTSTTSTSDSLTTTSSSVTSTTAFVRPPCCATELSAPSACGYSDSVQCLLSGNHPSGGNCDSATGTCVQTARSGSCCDLPNGTCVAGPVITPEDCADVLGGTYGMGICDGQACQP